MNKYVNPPYNSSLATSCAKFVMASSEGRTAALFTEGVSSSAEGELAIDETASKVSLAPNVCVVPGVSAAVQEGEEYVEDFVDPVSVDESAARHLEGEADDNDSLVLLIFIVLFCFNSLVCFVAQRSFFLTHMIFLSLPNLSRTLAVHRNR